MTEHKRKTFDATKMEVEPEKREVIATISTNVVDRDGEVVLPQGLDKKNYAGNPIVLVDHDYRIERAVGKALWIKRDGDRIIAKARITDKTQLGRDVFGLIQDGIITATSIGFHVHDQSPPTEKEIKMNPLWEKARNIIRKWSLLEFSFVTIPSNPEALTMAVSKGYSQETVDFINGGNTVQAKDLIKRNVWEWEVDELPMPTYAKAIDSLPTPKFCRAWKQVETRLESLKRILEIDDVIARYKGQVS